MRVSMSAAVVLTALTFVAAPVLVQAQESKSAPLAKELARLMEAAKVDSIAAPDPASGAFVAAIYVPGTQLLVVSGRFEGTDIGNYRLSRKEFRELYMDLMGGSVAASKRFASDVSADGLAFKPAGSTPADTWEQGGTSHAFEGARKAKLKDDEYTKIYSDADAEYARMLALLVEQAKHKSGTQAAGAK